MKRFARFTIVVSAFAFATAIHSSSSNLASAASPVPASKPDYARDLNHINPTYMVTAKEAQAWHEAKGLLGPALSGAPSWNIFMNVIETKLREYGAVDVERFGWTYDRWHTTEWPNDKNWSLVSDGKPIKVAHYGANSGSTPEAGATADLIFYDPASPPASIEGKIVVFQLVPETKDTPPAQRMYESPEDYLYLSNPESFPDPKDPRAVNLTVHLRSEMSQVNRHMRTLIDGKAAGAIHVFDSGYDRLAGLYTFGVPRIHQMPTLFLDRNEGKKVIADAKAGRKATLRLIAEVTPTDTYQLVAYLPGKNYGTPQDQQIYLVTHTDGPSISQDDGGYGMLAVAEYFSHIPQAERPRSIMFFFDNRHFMPGAEGAFRDKDWRTLHPEMWDKIVATIGMEHLGQIEYIEEGDKFSQTGKPEHSRLHCTDNDRVIEMAIKSVKDNGLSRVSVQCVDRPGLQGLSQGTWFGLGGAGRSRGIPGYAIMGDMGAYWATRQGIEAFDVKHFLDEVETMAQLTGELMLSNLDELKPKNPPGARRGARGARGARGGAEPES